jgi:hypothetical protein
MPHRYLPTIEGMWGSEKAEGRMADFWRMNRKAVDQVKQMNWPYWRSLRQKFGLHLHLPMKKTHAIEDDGELQPLLLRN